MAWTVITLEEALISRGDAWFDFLDWNKNTDGTNPYCAGPIRDALLTLEYSVSDLSQPVDADLAAVESTDYIKLLEVADVFLFQTLLDSVSVYVDIQVAQRDEKLSQMAERLEKTVNRKLQYLQKKYGLFYTMPEFVKIGLNFQTKADDAYPS